MLLLTVNLGWLPYSLYNTTVFTSLLSLKSLEPGLLHGILQVLSFFIIVRITLNFVREVAEAPTPFSMAVQLCLLRMMEHACTAQTHQVCYLVRTTLQVSSCMKTESILLQNSAKWAFLPYFSPKMLLCRSNIYIYMQDMASLTVVMCVRLVSTSKLSDTS